MPRNSPRNDAPLDRGTDNRPGGNVVALRRLPASRRSSAADPIRISRAAAGDAGAWAALVTQHLPAVTRCAAYMLGDAAEAEDVAQETFLRLHRKLASWEGGEDGLSSWLHRVAVNLSIDRHRRPAKPASLSDVGDVADPAGLDGPLDRKRHVEAALAALPERQRAALVLVHYQGFSGREAAAALDVSVEARESLLARARRTLRNDLAPLRADLLGATHD